MTWWTSRRKPRLPRSGRTRSNAEKRTPSTANGRRIQYGYGNNLPPTNTEIFSYLPDKHPAFRIKKSYRWAERGPLIEGAKFPLISSVGKYTGVSVLEADCRPCQLVATVVSTIASRLESHLMKHQGKDIMIKHKWLTVRAAYLYAVTKNGWFIDRFLALSRSNSWKVSKRAILGLLKKFSRRMDAYNRFVYDQVSFQTYWLSSRGPRVAPRDKSISLKSLSKKDAYMAIFSRRDEVDIRSKSFGYAAQDISRLIDRRSVVRRHPFPIGPEVPPNMVHNKTPP